MMSQSADNLVLRIGRRIAALRKAKGLTQAQLAERLAIAQKNVHRLESGTQNLTLRTIAKIADAILKFLIRSSMV
jgi:UDP-N-acetylglucosamine 1-carboxyvinyltransferase